MAILLAIALLYAGVFKIWIDPAEAQSRFLEMGLPDFMPYLTGTLEIAAGFLLLVPLLRTAGAVLTVLVMTAAIATHWANGQGFSQWWLPLMLLLIATAIVRARPVRLSQKSAG